MSAVKTERTYTYDTSHKRPCHLGNPDTGNTRCGLWLKDGQRHPREQCVEENHVRCPVCFEEDHFA